MKKGFTLIELLVVIAIVAVLAAVVAPNAFRAIEKGRDSAGMTDFKSIKTACHGVFADTTNWPADASTGQNIISDTSSWTNWDGPYLDNWPATNPWGGTGPAYRIQNDAVRNWDGVAGNDNAVYLEARGVDTIEFGRVDRNLDSSDGAAAGSVQHDGATTMFMIIAMR